MAQPKVFVSHSRVDDAFAEQLVKDLRAVGTDAWLDTEQLGAGDFQERIDAALANCEWFVLVLTRSALASPWVQQEVRAANILKNQGRIRELVFIQAGPLEHRELPPLWGVYNIFDAAVDYAAARDRVLKSVGIFRQETLEPMIPVPMLVVNPPPQTPIPEPEAYVICATCHARNTTSQHFCSTCGHILARQEMPMNNMTDSLRCPECGTLNFRLNRFCVTCGGNLHPSNW